MLHISLLRIGHALSGHIIPKESENVLQAKYKPTNQDTKKPSGKNPRRLMVLDARPAKAIQRKK